jgi:hypothetical protein
MCSALALTDALVQYGSPCRGRRRWGKVEGKRQDAIEFRGEADGGLPQTCSSRCRSKPRPSGSSGRRSSTPRANTRRRRSSRRPPEFWPAPRSLSSSGFCRRSGSGLGTEHDHFLPRAHRSRCVLLDRSPDAALALISPTWWSGGRVVGAGQASGGGERSARVLGEDAAGRCSSPMDNTTGRAEKRCEPSDSLAWRQDWLS